jgi:hypothetical protein
MADEAWRERLPDFRRIRVVVSANPWRTVDLQHIISLVLYDVEHCDGCAIIASSRKHLRVV